MTMADRTARNSLVALAAAAAVTFAGAAHASLYDEDYDPFLFSGGARFQVGDNCVAHNGEFAANSIGCSPVDMEASPLPFVTVNDGTHTSALNFGGFTGDSVDMVQVAVIGLQFVGIDTNPIGGFTAVDATDFPGFFFLQFGYVPTYSGNFASIEAANLVSVANFVQIYHCSSDVFSEGCILQGTANRVTITRVPEPGTLALILGGLGAGWFARRKKATA